MIAELACLVTLMLPPAEPIPGCVQPFEDISELRAVALPPGCCEAAAPKPPAVQRKAG